MTVSYNLSELAERLGAELVGDGTVRIHRVATLESASAGDLVAIAQRKYSKSLDTLKASAAIVGPELRDTLALPRLVSNNPYAAFARALTLFHPRRAPQPGTHPSAVIDASAQAHPSSEIGAYVVIGARATVAAGCIIGSGVQISDDVSIGENSLIHSGVTIYAGCRIGARAIIHSGAIIGADGFGLAPEDGRWLKIPQVGAVTVGDDVEIGANTTIDRGTLEDTVIEDGVKLDNQIQIAHNVRIGAHTAIAACVGIAGSTTIGRHCTIGGAAGIIGHLEIADHVCVSAFTLISKSIREPGTYTSTPPFMKHRDWLKNSALARNLELLEKRLRALEQRTISPDDTDHSS